MSPSLPPRLVATLRTLRVPVVQLLWTAVLLPAVFRWQAVDLPDELLEFFTAWADFWRNALGDGTVPFWNPWKLNGASVFSEMPAVAPLHPLTLLLPWMSSERWLLIVLLIHPALSGWGVHVLARRLGAGNLGAWAAGLIWGAATPVLAALVDAQIDTLPPQTALPWAMVVADQLWQRLRDRANRTAFAAIRVQVALLAFLLGWPGLCGHARVAALSFVAVGVWVMARQLVGEAEGRPPWGPLLFSCFGAFALGGLLTAPVVLPTLRELALTRSAPPPQVSELIGQILRPTGLLQLVYPRALLIDERAYRVGVALLLAGVGLRADPRRQAALLAALVLLVMGMGNAGPLGPLLRPILWLLYPTETMAAASAVPLLCVLAGVGLERAASLNRRRALGLAAGVLCVGVCLVLAGSWEARNLYGNHLGRIIQLEFEGAVHGVCCVLLLVVAVALCGIRPGSAARAALLGVVLLDGLVFAWRIDRAIPSPIARPSWMTVEPVSLRGLQLRPGARLLAWPLPSPRDFAGSLGGDWTDPGHGWGRDRFHDPVEGIVREAGATLEGPLLVGSGAGLQVPLVGGRSKVPAMPYSVLTTWLAQGLPPVGQELAPPPRQGLAPSERPELFARLLELLHVQVVIGPRGEALPGTRFERDAGPRRIRAQVETPRPPALLSPDLLWAADRTEAARRTLDPEIDLRVTAVILPLSGSSVPQSVEVRGPPGPAVDCVVQAYSPGIWRVELPSGHPAGVLTLADRPHPGWTARDQAGSALPVVSANLVQLGVLVGPEVQTVAVDFTPPGLALGGFLGLLGLAGTAGVFLGRPRTRRASP